MSWRLKYWSDAKAISDNINRNWNKIHKLMENKNYDPSLDDQIKFIEEMFNLSRGERDKSDWRKISGLKDPAIYPYNKSEKIYLSIKENLLIIKSFRESSIHQQLIPPCTPPSPEMQMKDALDRGELPDYITSTELVDVEKVITDLLVLVKDVGKQIQWPPKWIETAEQVQNAEAALGMLLAFKKEREVPKTGSAHWATTVEDMENRVYSLGKTGLIKQLSEKIEGGSGAKDTATAIIWAIEEILRIKPS